MTKSKTYKDLVAQVQKHYDHVGKALSFMEYLDIFFKKPKIQCRGAAKYILDTFDHYGSRLTDSPTGKVRRFSLFDAEFADQIGRVAGQEEAQDAIYKHLNNFVRHGRVNHLILLHGPNGSAKTSLIHAIIQAMEHYSSTDQGALYQFRWLFPSEKIARSNIGFGKKGSSKSAKVMDSFAHLPGEDLDAVLECEFRDHPLLLIPVDERRRLLEKLLDEGKLASDFPLPEYLLRGNLCAKCRKIHDALLASYGGNSQAVLKHIQVQRLHLSWRYRSGIATVEPQMHVDAAQQQLTASRGLASLPPAIAHLSLFESRGPLVDANRGLLEYNDLLKRPVDTFKYLLSTCETGQVTLDRSTLFLDTVLLGSTNEMLLDAFKEYADFASFKGRVVLVRVPYLRKVSEEIQIYQDQISEDSLDRHLAPHTLYCAALWAILTRLRRPDPSYLKKEIKEVIEKLTPAEKAELYDSGTPPSQLTSVIGKELVGILPELYRLSGQDYEGRTGASAREVRMLLMNTAQQEDRHCVTPLGLFDEIKKLVADKSVFAFLKQAPQGDYLDQEKILEMLETAYLDLLEDEASEAMGLVTETGYIDLLNRYILNVTHWLKKEKLDDPLTGQTIAADENLMKEVETIIRPDDEEIETFRKNLIGRIGAFVLDEGHKKQTGSPPDYSKVFPALFDKIKDDFFEKRKVNIQLTYQKFLEFIQDDKDPGGKDSEIVKNMKRTLTERFGYCDHCTKEAMTFLLKKRYS
ncbi:MAG: serine protein kinase PrkA [Deltaproteobacteria bacterium]|nr:serine protein kinase PrkA [Deltaproteobacteria bacterium]